MTTTAIQTIEAAGLSPILSRLRGIKDCYEYTTKVFIDYLCKEWKGELTAESVQAYIKSLGQVKDGKRLRASTRAFYISGLKNRLRGIFAGDSLSSNDKLKGIALTEFLNTIKSPKRNSLRVPKNRILSDDEIGRLLSGSVPPISLWCELLLDTGLRISEALNLLRTDCTIHGNTVTARVCGKGSKERFVEFPKDLYDRLTTFFDSGDTICSHNGKPYSRSYASIGIARATKRLCGHSVSAHGMRHSFATRFAANHQQADSIKKLSKMLGHSSTSLTLNLYVDSTPDSTDWSDCVVRPKVSA